MQGIQSTKIVEGDGGKDKEMGFWIIFIKERRAEPAVGKFRQWAKILTLTVFRSWCCGLALASGRHLLATTQQTI